MVSLLRLEIILTKGSYILQLKTAKISLKETIRVDKLFMHEIEG